MGGAGGVSTSSSFLASGRCDPRVGQVRCLLMLLPRRLPYGSPNGECLLECSEKWGQLNMSSKVGQACPICVGKTKKRGLVLSFYCFRSTQSLSIWGMFFIAPEVNTQGRCQKQSGVSIVLVHLSPHQLFITRKIN